MNRAEYIKNSLDYFKGGISMEQLMDILEREVSFLVEGGNLLPKERYLLISNYALQTPELYIPSKKIEKFKGGNKYGYKLYHFPIILQILFRKLIKIKFTAIVNDVGWNEVAQNAGHLVVGSEVGNGVDFVTSRLNFSQEPIVIFPEGGSRNFSDFHSGFLHIALKLKIRYLVVAVMSQKPSLKKNNHLKVIEVIDLFKIEKFDRNFVNEQRLKMINSLEKFGI